MKEKVERERERKVGGKNEVSSGSFGQMVPNALVPNGTKQEESGQKMAVTSRREERQRKD